MNLYRVVFQNLYRRKGRTILLICGQAAGIAAAAALLIMLQAARLELGNQIDEFGANLVVVPRNEGLELSHGGTPISRLSIDLKQLTETDLLNIEQIPDRNSINIISPKMIAAVEANHQQVLLVGVIPAKEFLMKPWFAFAPTDDPEAGQRIVDPVHFELPDDALLAGAAAAEALAIQPGDTVPINGREFKVAGVFQRIGSTEDGLLYANLPVVQSLLGRPGELSMVELSAYCNACPIDQIAAQLTAALPNGRVTALGQAALMRGETIDRFALFAALLAGAALIAAALLVLTIMTASVNERTREIGIFRVLGFRRTHVMQIILMEAGIGGFLGGLTGCIAGNLIAVTAGFYLAGITTAAPWQPALILPAAFAAALLAAAAGIYPAVRAAKLDPVAALRFI
ncbi:MAG: ABC transporter permease [Bacillota bacterium]